MWECSSGTCFIDGLIVLLQAADAGPCSRGEDDDFRSMSERPAHERPSDHGSKAGHGEGAIDRQTGAAEVGARRRLRQFGIEGMAHRNARAVRVA